MSRSASAAAILALACVGVTLTAAAQKQPRARFGIGLGLAAPQGEFRGDVNGEGFNAGWQALALLEFREPQRPVGVRVDVIVGENPANDLLNADVTAFAGQTVTSKLRTFGANVDLIYSLGSARRRGGAYLLGGIGTCRVTLSETSQGITADTSETKFAWNAGGGLSFPFGTAAMFLEARYVSVSSTFFASGKAPFVALTAGVRLGRR
jgi:opacity protein-like surface antigen